MADPQEDPFADLETKQQGSVKKSTGEDPFADLESKHKKSGGFDLSGLARAVGSSAKAFASAVPTGLMSIPEQAINLQQYGHRHIPFPLNNVLTMDQQPLINAGNKLAGAPKQPYLDVTGQYNRSPQAWLGGQTPLQAQEGHPLESLAGDVFGSLPLNMIGGATTKGPLLGKLAKGAMTGAGYGGALSGLGEAAQEVKDQDQIDPANIGTATGWGALTGAGLGIIGEGLGHRFAKKPTPESTPTALPYSIIPPAPPDPSGITVRSNNWSDYQQPLKRLPYNPNQVIIPPGPTERLHARGRELFEQDAAQALDEVPLAGHAEAQGATPPPEEPKESTPPPPTPEKSWRTWRDEAAQAAEPEEAKVLRPLAHSKVNLDQSAARLEGALRQVDPKLVTRYHAQIISPEDYAKVAAYIKEHGGTSSRLTKAVEATLAEEHSFIPHYNFQTDDPVKEIKGLVKDFIEARDAYEAARDKAGKHLEGRINQTIRVGAKDSYGNVRAVNIKMREQAAPRSIKFPTQELQDGYNKLRQSLKHDYTMPFWQTFDRFLKNQAPHGNEIIKQIFPEISKSAQAKILLAIGLTAAYFLSDREKAEAAEPSPTLIGKVVNNLRKAAWIPGEGYRAVSRMTGTQLTTDIIRQGFDGKSRMFAAKRDQYFAALRRRLAFAKVTSEAEDDAIKGMSPSEILKTENLKGWNKPERQKLAQIVQLHSSYVTALKNEIERVEKLGAKEGWTGKNRYLRMLKLDLNDLIHYKASDGGLVMPLLSKLTGGLMQSIFYGNYRTAAFHFAEAAVAFGSKHPAATAQALHGLATNPVYREFAIANSPKGMFQQVIEGQEKLWIQKKMDSIFNDRIDRWIQSMPHGQVIHDTLSAQLPERGKLGLGATITAVANAGEYPGGAERYMRDWLAFAKNGTRPPDTRSFKFAQIEVQNFIEENKAIMFLPDGPIKERTMFQRHGELVSKVYPFLRSVTQQTRFFASLLDDMGNDLARGNHVAALKSMRTFLTGYIVVGAIAGSHAIPDPVWAILESIDKDGTLKLRDAIDDGQRMISGGYQMQDFAVKWMPYLKMYGPAVPAKAEQMLHQLANPKDKKTLAMAVVGGISMTILNRVGPWGTQNLAYIYERLQMGMEGSERYRKYDENPIMQKAMGRPFATKLYDKKLPFDMREGVIHSLFKVENIPEQKANTEAEAKAKKQFQKDIKKVGKNWTHLH